MLLSRPYVRFHVQIVSTYLKIVPYHCLPYACGRIQYSCLTLMPVRMSLVCDRIESLSCIECSVPTKTNHRRKYQNTQPSRCYSVLLFHWLKSLQYAKMLLTKASFAWVSDESLRWIDLWCLNETDPLLHLSPHRDRLSVKWNAKLLDLPLDVVQCKSLTLNWQFEFESL